MANIGAINRAVTMLRAALDKDERIISLSADSDHAIVVIETWSGERKHFVTEPSKILADTTTQ
jgi:hypothetical protein